MTGKCAVCGAPADDDFEYFPLVCTDECLNTWWGRHESHVAAVIDTLRSARRLSDVAATTPEEQLFTIKAAHDVGLVSAEHAYGLGLTVGSSHKLDRAAEECGERLATKRRERSRSLLVRDFLSQLRAVLGLFRSRRARSHTAQ